MRFFQPLLILTPLLFLVGCADDGAPPPDRFRPQQIVVNSDLRGDLVFSPVMISYKGGLLHAEVPVRSNNDFDIEVQYRFSYFDDGHKSVGSPTAWQPLLLRSNDFQTIVGDAPSPDARDFEIEIRSAPQ